MNDDDVLGTDSCSSVKHKFPDSVNPNMLSFDIVITISSYKKMSTNMETFILYNIDTSGSKGSFSVSRRYGDFEWLSQLLTERYPMAIIPPLPPKHNVTAIERFAGEFIDQRQRTLCHFLRRLVAHPIVGLDHECWSFLTLDPPAFTDLMRAWPTPGKLESLLHSLQGLTGSMGKAPGGCVDNMYRDELQEAVTRTGRIGTILAGLDRVVLRSADQWTSLGQVASKAAPHIHDWSILADMGTQCTATGEAVKHTLAPWVHEYGLYCAQAERVVRRRDSLEHRLVTSQAKAAQGKADEANETQQLHDALSRSNADLRSEFDRWQTQQSEETRTWLSTFADVHVAHFEKEMEVWRQCLASMSGCPDDGDCGSGTL